MGDAGKAYEVLRPFKIGQRAYTVGEKCVLGKDLTPARAAAALERGDVKEIGTSSPKKGGGDAS